MKKLKHIYISCSGMKQYKDCARRWEFERMHGLVPAGTLDESTAAHFKGTLVHESIDALYAGKPWEEKFDSLIEPGAMIKTIDENKSGSIKHTKQIIREYIQFYNCPNDPDFEVLDTEKTIEVPLNEYVTYTAKIDKVVKCKHTGEIKLVDHKTTSNIYSWVRPTVALSDQFTSYIYVAQQNGLATDTLIVDAISTSRSHLGDPSKMFQRFEAVRAKSQLEEWRDRLLFDAARLKFDIEHNTFTTNQADSCIKFGGCPYMSICGEAPENRVQIMKNLYKVLDNKWYLDKVVLEGDE